MTATTPNQPAEANRGVAAQDGTDAQSWDHTKCPTAREEFTAWLTASCQRQALPVTINDPTTLAAIATLLR
jgi:hypothetical protein